MKATILRIVTLALLVAMALVVGLKWSVVEAWFAAAGLRGAAFYGAGFILLTTGCFPVSLLGVTAGMIYGPWLGLGVVVPAGLISGLVMFILGRSLLRRPISRWVAGNPRLRVFERLVAGSDVRINLLARLSPFNYGLVCYTLAAGATSSRAYLIGLAGVLPSLLGQVLIGALLGRTGRSLQTGEGLDTTRLVLSGIGVLALALLGWQVGRLALQAWREAAAAVQEEGDGP